MTDVSLLEKLQIAHITTGQKMFKEASDAIAAQAKRIAELEAAMREIYEVYAGSEGFIPETCAEGYQQQLIKNMSEIAAKYMRKGVKE